MSRKLSSDRQNTARRPIDVPTIVRERVLVIIEHNTGGPQPPAVRETSIVLIAVRAGCDVPTVRSVLDELATGGEIERHTTTNGTVRIALAGED